jgi:hypothetical protein
MKSHHKGAPPATLDHSYRVSLGNLLGLTPLVICRLDSVQSQQIVQDDNVMKPWNFTTCETGRASYNILLN